MALNQTAAANLTDKQRQQAAKALELKAAGKPIGPGQRAALKAYNQELLSIGVKPKYGIGSGNKPAAKPGAKPGAKPSGGGPAGGGRGSAADPARDAEPSWLNVKGKSGIDDIINDPNRLNAALTAAGIPGATLEERLKNATIGYSFSGVEQWRANLSGDTSIVQGDPSLQNVGLDTDINMLRRIVGEIAGAFQGEGTIEGVQQAWQGRMSRVPEWAAPVFDQLAPAESLYQGLLESRNTGSSGTGNWTLEQLASPEINLSGQGPLFGQGDLPISLQQFTGFQEGEQAFARNLTAPEWLLGMQPKYNEYFNRPAGSAAPNAGLSFGVDPGLGSLTPFDPGYQPAYANHPIRSPLWQQQLIDSGGDVSALDPANALYARWSAYNMPGDYTMNGTMNLTNAPFGRHGSFDVFTGGGGFALGGSAEFPQMDLLNQFLTNEIPPQWLGGLENAGYTDWSQMPLELLMEYNPAFAFAGYPGMAAALGRPDIYWAMPWAAPFAPWNIGEDPFRRMEEVRDNTTAPTY